MGIAKKHIEAPTSFFLVCIQIVILFSISRINLQGLNLLGLATASPEARGNGTDQQALLQFKAKITGDHLEIMKSWNSSSHFCQWHGVTCGRKHRRVTKLELKSLELSGSLSPYIGNLSFLRELSLAGNNFYSEIPQEIGCLRRLEILDLINNSLSGEIPSNLSACSKLTLVDMRSNQLTGEIPALLGLLSNLKSLFLFNNSLRGSIPSSLGNLSSLEVLALMMNGLTGIIPEALGQLKHLLAFSVFRNAISGVVPVTMFNLSNIRDFDIGENKIQGTLPSNLATTMPYLEFFSVSINQFSGTIPTSISNASNLNLLQFDENKFTGKVPSLEKLDKLSQLLVDINYLGHGEEGDLNFLCTLVNDTKLEIIDISGNNFGGTFPKCISNFSITLWSLQYGGNKILGRIPNGIGNLINLEILWASQNQLSGPIPFNVGKLQKLKMFSAHSNFLSGNIPYSIGNLTVLIGLDLHGNNLHGSIPSSLSYCQNLNSLSFSMNNLSGAIPPEIFRIPSLSIALDLSSNCLTGELPLEVENLKNLGALDVSQNRLSGLLPNNLGSCVSLEELFLNGNSFEGSIPSSLNSLRGLVELDISDNHLSGVIPEFFVSFGALKYLNLSFNDFEGVIPSEGVFKNASAIFIVGNNKLCGGITELNLSRCNPRTSPSTSLKLKIAIVVCILGVTVAFSSILFLIWFRKKTEHQPRTTCLENSILQLSYQNILQATNGFSMQNLIGSGSFGSVYKGILEENGTFIAVKVLNLLNRGASRSFLVECEALKNIRHRNLVKILTAISGVDYQGNDFKALVYEFMANGSLEDWLHPSTCMNESDMMRNLDFFQRLNVAIDVAHALEYLHHRCETPIVHCDLKPSNILLDEEMVGHLSDFGIAKILSADRHNNSLNQSSFLGFRGTIGYAPPEYGMGGELSTKGDVYSYGILLLEMFTGKRPTHDMFKEGYSIRNFVMEALRNRVFEIIDPIFLQDGAIQGTLADHVTLNDMHLLHLNSIFKIGLACSVESASERMDMSDVVTKLSSTRDKLLRPTRLHRDHKIVYDVQSAGKIHYYLFSHVTGT